MLGCTSLFELLLELLFDETCREDGSYFLLMTRVFLLLREPASELESSMDKEASELVIRNSESDATSLITFIAPSASASKGLGVTGSPEGGLLLSS